jgi:lysophospholipase L1-like esterase
LSRQERKFTGKKAIVFARVAFYSWRMKKLSRLLFPIVVSFAFLTATQSYAQGTNQTVNTAIVPVLRTNPTNWVARHDRFVDIAKQGGVGLLFLGDSITDGWRTRGSNVWNKAYAPRHAANFGIGGDRTEHVLWRIDHGELDGIKPKVVVLMIGTNNSNSNSPTEIADAIKLIIGKIHAKTPGSKVLLLGVFPRNRKNDSSAQIEAPKLINPVIARFDDGKTVRYLNINEKFVDPDGQVPADIMPDFLHPNDHGYQLWADAMEPLLAEMLK